MFDKISWSFLSGIFLQLNCQGTFYNCQGNNYINLSWIVTFSLTIVKSSLTNVRTSLTVVKSSLTIVKISLTLLLSGKKVSVIHGLNGLTWSMVLHNSKQVFKATHHDILGDHGDQSAVYGIYT